jgi:hypothetical protein
MITHSHQTRTSEQQRKIKKKESMPSSYLPSAYYKWTTTTTTTKDKTMASSYLPSAYSATQRRSSQTSDNPITAGPLYPGLVPAPNPRPIFQFLAFGLFILLGLLQLLPATHFRDPFDPSRNWVPLHSNLASPVKFILCTFFVQARNFMVFV